MVHIHIEYFFICMCKSVQTFAVILLLTNKISFSGVGLNQPSLYSHQVNVDISSRSVNKHDMAQWKQKQYRSNYGQEMANEKARHIVVILSLTMKAVICILYICFVLFC